MTRAKPAFWVSRRLRKTGPFSQVQRRPLQVELLDAAGKTLKREAGDLWMRRGEQRVCVGCQCRARNGSGQCHSDDPPEIHERQRT